MQKNKTNFLSLVVPAYKKEKTINEDLESIEETLKEGLPAVFDFEIICVVDGFLDKTYQNAKKITSKHIKVLGYDKNAGKGYAVRFGMKEAKGDFISFLDAGREISPKGVMMLMSHMEWYNADIIVGSKRHPASMVNYPFLRRIISVGYHTGVKILFGISVTDTQSGIKIFKRKVIDKILPRLLVKRYAMDIEMLSVANYLGFNRIYEAPIEVKFDKNTSTIKWSTVIKMLQDTLAVFYRLRILHYYDDKNKQAWLSNN
ncbi:glycosyltransferase family 2 protein [soil metagenome]